MGFAVGSSLITLSLSGSSGVFSVVVYRFCDGEPSLTGGEYCHFQCCNVSDGTTLYLSCTDTDVPNFVYLFQDKQHIATVHLNFFLG